MVSQAIRLLSGARSQARRDVQHAVGRTFERLTDEGFVVLHHRHKPGSKSNIDHIVIGPQGVCVIEAEPYTGPLEIRATRSFVRPTYRQVFVKGRAQDKRVDGMERQLGWVRDAAGDLITRHQATLKAVLCFVGVDLGPNQKPALVGDNDVIVTWPRRFVDDVSRQGPLSAEMVDALTRRIATALPPAA